MSRYLPWADSALKPDAASPFSCVKAKHFQMLLPGFEMRVGR
jgi:hypothetical protein